MTQRKQKLFYKGGTLSTVQVDGTPYVIISANSNNICEIACAKSQAHLLATDLQQSTLISRLENINPTAYSPYGHDNNPPVSPLVSRFTGQPWLTGSISYPLGNGHRHYSTMLMRFMSPDAISPFGNGGMNAYAYCADDPINKVDPTGQTPGHIVKKLMGGYAYKKLSPRLDSANADFSEREYRSLGTSLTKRERKNSNKGGTLAAMEKRRLNAQRHKYDSLAPWTVEGKTSYYDPSVTQSLTQDLLTKGLPTTQSTPNASKPKALGWLTMEQFESRALASAPRPPNRVIENDLDRMLAKLRALRGL
ncbi:RHS repeat-associated core domain-containing protein [Pseudomonas sp. Rh2]|uniref:RHS repeat-associated core domain-containing protein n=1 Tax=unclassified Pseudomonas TaxID=196821 RepID=UPI00345CA965